MVDAQAPSIKQQIETAIRTCHDNRHYMVDGTVTQAYMLGCIAVCDFCGAILRYYQGRASGEALQTTCRMVPAT